MASTRTLRQWGLGTSVSGLGAGVSSACLLAAPSFPASRIGATSLASLRTVVEAFDRRGLPAKAYRVPQHAAPLAGEPSGHTQEASA